MNFVAMRHKALKTDVGNVSLSMAIRQGLVDPNLLVNSVKAMKGNQINISELVSFENYCKIKFYSKKVEFDLIGSYLFSLIIMDVCYTVLYFLEII